RMGVTQGALFRHFPSKDAILQAVMSWVADHLLGRIDKAAHAAASPLASLEAMFMAHIGFVADHPGVPRMIFGELQRPGDTLPKRMVETMIATYGKRLRRWLEAGQASGEIRADLDLDAAAALFIGSVQGLVLQSLMSGDPRRLSAGASDVFAI